MKKLIALFLFLAVIGFSPPSRAQNSISGTLSAAGTTCATANACLTLPLGANIGGAGITVSANASANTLQFEVSGDNATFSGASCTPTSSSTSVTNTTSTGNWVCPASTLAGMSVLRVRMSTLAGGSSTVSINSSFASAKAGGGGTGSGTVTNVSGTTNQIDVATGTTTPVVSLDAAIVLPGSLTAPTGGSITVSGTGTNNATDINGTHLASLGTGIVKNTTTTGVPSIAVAGDFPTLNQNTSGTAANLSGTPALPNGTTATSQSAGDNTTSLATDAFVTTAVNNAIAAVNPAVAVIAASTASITGTYTAVGAGIGDTFTVTATGAFSLDGVALNTIGQRVLLKNQASAYQNGVYTVTIPGSVGVSPVFTRALDYDQPSDVNNTGSIPVQSGTANTTTSWLLTSQVTSIGPAGSALTYAQFSLNPSTVVLNGVDINSSNQVTATHLAAALPVAQGGTGAATAAADTVFGNATGSTAAPGFTTNPVVTSLATAGTTGGFWQCTQGTANGHATANTFTFECPAAVTAYELTIPAAAATGLPHWTNTSNVVAETISAVTSADATGNTSGSGNFCLVTNCVMVTPTLGAATATSLDGSTIGATTPSTVNSTGYSIQGISNPIFLASNFTSGSGTTALQAITGLSFTLKASTAQNRVVDCNLRFTQATQVSDAFGVQDVTTAPTRIDGYGLMSTGGPTTTTPTFGVLTNLTTTTATAIVTATPTVATANFVQLHFTVQQPSGSASVLQLMLSQATAADVIVVLAGSSCSVN